ncbi:MAG: prepilin peptidase, partial [Brevinematia bacterium]
MSLEVVLGINILFLVILSIYDMLTWTIPNYLVLVYVLFAVVILVLSPQKFYNILGFLSFIFIMAILYIYSAIRKVNLSEMFGGGDIKVLFAFSLVAGGTGFIVSLAIGSLVGIFYGIIAKVNKV